jgi:hypothetical protein
MVTSNLSNPHHPAHAELVEARTTFGACLDKLGMSGFFLLVQR